MTIKREDIDALDGLVRRETEEYLRRSSISFLSCAISLCVSHMSLDDVAELLTDHADQLREFG